MILEKLPDLWERLQTAGKKTVLYGMGNGADKILDICARKSIPVVDFFANDDFVRGQEFHGKRVKKWEEIKTLYGAENLIVLVAFGTARQDVLEQILRVAKETELYVPDVPVFGEGLFDKSFAVAHADELEEVRTMFEDTESLRIFDLILEYKITGNIHALLAARSDPAEVWKKVVCADRLTATGDLGAYTGDTVRELLEVAPHLQTVYAMEPDARNFRKLELYAGSETRAKIFPVRAAAWNKSETLVFDTSGNRNAAVTEHRSAILAERPVRTVELPALPPDAVFGDARVDYLKYDVEGSEREALEGSTETLNRCRPVLLVSLYHRVDDLFALPRMIREKFPFYNKFFLRRFGGIPAWDLNFYAREN